MVLASLGMALIGGIRASCFHEQGISFDPKLRVGISIGENSGIKRGVEILQQYSLGNYGKIFKILKILGKYWLSDSLLKEFIRMGSLMQYSVPLRYVSKNETIFSFNSFEHLKS